MKGVKILADSGRRILGAVRTAHIVRLICTEALLTLQREKWIRHLGTRFSATVGFGTGGGALGLWSAAHNDDILKVTESNSQRKHLQSSEN